jgi:hypothetical protein
MFVVRAISRGLEMRSGQRKDRGREVVASQGKAAAVAA